MQWSVYLAGKMTGLSREQMTGWRNKAKRQLRALGYLVHDPCETDLDDDADARMIVVSNLFQLSKADIVLMEFAHPDKSPGTFSELGVCVGSGKPVIAFTQFDERCKPHTYATHPWIVGGTAGVYKTVEGAIGAIVRAFPVERQLPWLMGIDLSSQPDRSIEYGKFRKPEGIEG